MGPSNPSKLKVPSRERIKMDMQLSEGIECAITLAVLIVISIIIIVVGRRHDSAKCSEDEMYVDYTKEDPYPIYDPIDGQL